MSKAVKKTRRQWAAAIRAYHKRFVDDFFQIGKTLIAARDALPHGSFLKMIEHDLPFKARTAQMLMKIAADPRIANAQRVALLPLAFSAIYELTRLSDAAFEQALRSGTINPEMTREQASQMVRVQVTYDEPVVAVPRYIEAPHTEQIVAVPFSRPAEPEEAAPIMRVVTSAVPPADVPITDVGSLAPLALSRIERLVDDLEATIKRGDVRVDEFKGRIRVVAGRLLSLVETIN